MTESVLKIIFDTNTLVSASLNEFSVSGRAFFKAVSISTLLASEETLEQFKEVIYRNKFDKYASLEKRVLFYENYVGEALALTILIKIDDCRDSKDNKFLELALTGDATIIVTGDADLLILHPYRGILIMNSSAFLDWKA